LQTAGRTISLLLLITVLVTAVPPALSEEEQGGENRKTIAGTYDAAVIPIEGDIDPFHVVFLRRSIAKAKKSGAGTIVFSINTFGGRVDSALQMATLIGSLRDIETVAFIPAEPESVGVSWSAGALISFACKKIYMAPGTSIGAAAPVYQTSEGMQAAEEKTVSAVRTQLAALAEKNGFPPEVAIAMVDKDVELTAVRVGQGWDFSLERKAEGEGNGEAVADLVVLSPPGKLLSLTAGEMERYGISSGSPVSLEELAGDLGVENFYEIKLSPADRVVNLITGAAVTSLLLMVGLIALYMEISSPGFGVPGTVAIAAFALLFLSSGLMGTLHSVELLLFLAGIVLLVVEVFLIPGFGIAGITGLAFMTTGLILSRQEFFLPDTEWQWNIFTRNLLLVFGTLTVSFLVMAVIMMFFPKIKLFRRLILTGGIPETVNGISTQRLTAPVSAGDNPSASDILVGKVGTVISTLRPSGKISLEGEVLQVVTEGQWIEAGKKVKICGVEGNRITVEELRQ
jgi:membrane-bound serine protease (ClpP class)